MVCYLLSHLLSLYHHPISHYRVRIHQADDSGVPWAMTSSLVTGVEDLLFKVKTAVVALESRLVEGLGLVELVAVGRPHLVSPLILLSLPGRAVPFLPVARVATLAIVGSFRLLKLRVVVEGDASATCTPVGLVMLSWGHKARTSRRNRVAGRVEVSGVVEICLGAISPASHFEGNVVFGNELGVEACCGEVV